MSFLARVARQRFGLASNYSRIRLPIRASSTFKTIDHSAGEGKEQEFDGRFDEEGTIVVKLNGEEVWVPNVTYSLEWVLSTPTEFHLFAESPIIKETTEEGGRVAHAHAH